MPIPWGRAGLRRLALFASLLLVSVLAQPLGAEPPEDPAADYAPGEVLVKWAPGSRGQARAATRAANGLTHKQTLPLGGVEVAGIPGNRDPVAEAARLTKNPNIEYAQPNWLLEPVAAPDDPHFGLQWGLEAIGFLDAWPISDGDGVLVAVIDSGTDVDHEDLEDNIDPRGASFNGGTNPVPAPGHRHGTHVSGTIAAVTDNQIGVAGVAPAAKILPLTFLWPSGNSASGSTGDAILAINYAKDKGAKIANASWGSEGNNPLLGKAIDESGMVFVAAAGNGTANVDTTPFFPCAYELDNLICVASVTSGGALSNFSNYGHESVHVGAPGSGIYSTIPDNKYDWSSGTSMAAPHVSGVAALVASLYPDLEAERIVEHLKATAVPLASLAGKTTTGGMVNAATAVLPVRLSSDSVAFAPTGVTLTSTEPVTVTNTGPVSLDIAEVEADGVFGADADDCVGTLEAGASCNVDVTFTPPEAEEYEGTLTITHDGPGGTVTAALTGAGALAGVPHHFTVSAEDPEAGKAVTVEAQLRDPFGTEIEEDDHEVQWTSSRGSMSSSTSKTDGNGVATMEHTAANSVGSTTLTAVLKDDENVTGTATITVKPGPPTKYSVTVSSTSPTAGTNVTVQAQLRDTHNNAVPQDGTSVSWSSTNGGSFTPASSSTNSNGRASTTFTVASSGGTQHVVTATDSASRTGSSATITVQSASAGGGGFGGGGGGGGGAGGGGGGGGAPAPSPSPSPSPSPTATVPPGGTATTDPDGTGPTTANPVQAAVTTPTGGVVEIQAVKAPASGPTGFTMLPVRIEISAPPSTSDDPLQLTFALDSSLGVGLDELAVFRNGRIVGVCDGSTVADPDPCVTSRGVVGDDLRLVVLSSRASVWGFGVPAREQQPAYIPPSGCPIPAPNAGFIDVSSASPHARSINCVVWWDVARGTSSFTFSPAGQVTRAQMASFLARTVDEVGGVLPPAGRQFSDVDGVHADAINRLAAVGIVRGTAPGVYQPNAPVNREQMATFLVRAYEHVTGTPLPAGTPRFIDVSASVHRDAINKAAEAGFTTGRTATTYAPRDLVRRDQMASFLYRLLDALAGPR